MDKAQAEASFQVYASSKLETFEKYLTVMPDLFSAVELILIKALKPLWIETLTTQNEAMTVGKHTIESNTYITDRLFEISMAITAKEPPTGFLSKSKNTTAYGKGNISNLGSKLKGLQEDLNGLYFNLKEVEGFSTTFMEELETTKIFVSNLEMLHEIFQLYYKNTDEKARLAYTELLIGSNEDKQTTNLIIKRLFLNLSEAGLELNTTPEKWIDKMRKSYSRSH
jgi:hypothetical protein